MRVLLILTGFPSEKDPSKSIFNYKAYSQLREYCDINIMKLRALKPSAFAFKQRFYKDITYYELPLPIFPGFLSSLNQTQITSSLRRLLLSTSKLIDLVSGYDVIHAVGGGIAAQTAYLLSKQNNIPFLVQYIGSDVNFYLAKKSNRKSHEIITQNAKYNVFNSNRLKQTFETYFSDALKSRTIYRGVDLNEFNYHFEDTQSIKVLYLGGFTDGDQRVEKYDLKGGVTLLRVWEKLLSRQSGFNHSLLFGGPNSTSEQIFDDLGIAKTNLNQVEFIGVLDRQKVINHMQKSHIVVIPSHFEGLPNVLLEAMASGNLVIASKVGGIPEVIDHDENGLLFEPGDSEGLYKLLRNALNSPILIQNLSKAAFKRATAFSHKNFSDEYYELYESMIEGTRIS